MDLSGDLVSYFLYFVFESLPHVFEVFPRLNYELHHNSRLLMQNIPYGALGIVQIGLYTISQYSLEFSKRGKHILLAR